MKKIINQQSKVEAMKGNESYQDRSDIYESNDLKEVKRAYKEIPPKENPEFKKMISSVS